MAVADNVAVFRGRIGEQRGQREFIEEPGEIGRELEGVGAGLKEPVAHAFAADVAAEAGGGFEQPEGPSLPGEAVCGGQAGDAAADDRDGKLCG